MDLIHYSSRGISSLYSVKEQTVTHKPQGLWVSDDDCEDNWKTWCRGENFNLDRLTIPHRIVLSPNANVLILAQPHDLDAFTHIYSGVIPGINLGGYFINWQKVAYMYQGIIITPYIYQRRLTAHTTWYYGWDCASGCIWDHTCIASANLIHP